MKKLLFIAICFITLISFAQTPPDSLKVVKVVEIPINTEGLEKSFTDILKPYLEKTLTGLEKGAEYAVEEIPIVLQQYVIYEAIMAWLSVLLGIILLVIFIIYTKKTWKNKESWFYIKSYRDKLDPFPGIMFTVLGGIIILTLSLLLISNNIETAILATWFPKLFIVKEFLNYM